MGIIDKFRQRRRERIIKAVMASGLTVPSRRMINGSWLPRWIPFRYTAGGFAYNPTPKPGVGRFCAPPRPKESGRLWHLRCKLRPPHALFVIRRT